MFIIIVIIVNNLVMHESYGAMKEIDKIYLFEMKRIIIYAQLDYWPSYVPDINPEEVPGCTFLTR